MTTKDLHISITTTISASEAFEKIAHVGNWWLSSFTGKAEKLNDTFRVVMGPHGTADFKIAEVVPDRKIVWLVTDCFLSNYTDKEEWKGTTIVFELSEVNGKTRLDFTHVGLTPHMECYDDCAWGWDHYINGSLPKYFETGTGNPYKGPY